MSGPVVPADDDPGEAGVEPHVHAGPETFEETVISRFMGVMGVQRSSDLLDKLMPRQLDKMIDLTDQAARRDSEQSLRIINLTFAGFVIAGVMLLLGCWLFLHYEKIDALEKLAFALIGAAGGGGGVVALQKAKERT